MMHRPLIIRELGQQDYSTIWQAMRDFTDQRSSTSDDELWLVEHPPVYTLGQAGKPEHLLNPNDIPVIKTDRGGQVTYHGPGQQVAYALFDIRRLGIGVRQLVTTIEQVVVDTLKDVSITGYPKPDAQGVYVDEKKICSLGLRIRKGCSYHGLALNVDMDLTPFLGINPCGYQGLEMVDCKMLNPLVSLDDIKQRICDHFCLKVGYNQTTHKSGL